MKSKKILLTSVSLIFLFLFATNANALTTYIVEYPTQVKLGDLFTINIIFEYELDCNCLYGVYVWFYYAVNSDYTSSSWASGMSTYISGLENYPRLTNVSWTFDTTVFAYSSLEINDTIQFKIKYKTGHDDGIPVDFEKTVVTHMYEITIVEEITTETSAGIITSIFVLAAIVIFTRKRRGFDPYA